MHFSFYNEKEKKKKAFNMFYSIFMFLSPLHCRQAFVEVSIFHFICVLPVYALATDRAEKSETGKSSKTEIVINEKWYRNSKQAINDNNFPFS